MLPVSVRSSLQQTMAPPSPSAQPATWAWSSAAVHSGTLMAGVVGPVGVHGGGRREERAGEEESEEDGKTTGNGLGPWRTSRAHGSRHARCTGAGHPPFGGTGDPLWEMGGF
jgi:hypothetical protein